MGDMDDMLDFGRPAAARPRKIGSLESRSTSGEYLPALCSNMDVVVEEEVIAPEDLNADWIPVHTARKKARQPKIPSPKPSNPTERLASRSSPRPGFKPRPPQLPRLPDDDYKIVIRPRGGLNLSSMSTGKLQDLIFNAAQTNYDAARADQIRINATQNSILISTPSEERARTYFNLHTLRIGEENYPLATYVADPANTSRGIIFDVPEYDTPENISRYLIDYNHDPAILHARRMGKTNSVQIVFDSPEVPHWVSYHGAPYRCVLFKHKTEACNICFKIGHRADVCPSPRTNKCPRCGMDNPPTDHDCEVKCAVCRGPHPTGSPRCKKRFQQHPAIRRRQAQHPVYDSSQSSTPPNPRGRPRPRSQSRSKPRQAPQDKPPRQPAAPKQVSWASVASGPPGGDARDNELAALRREHPLLSPSHNPLRSPYPRLIAPPSLPSVEQSILMTSKSRGPPILHHPHNPYPASNSASLYMALPLPHPPRLSRHQTTIWQWNCRSFRRKPELDKVNALIRKTYKAALSLSPSTSTDRLLKLGVHNTAEELAEAHLTAQYERLSTTQAGRHILTSLQINFPSNPSYKCSLPLDIRQSLQRLGGREDVAYVDAAEYTRREAFALLAVNNAGSLLTSATLYTTLSEEAEEFSIALAMSNTSATTIVSDSKTAIRNFMKGRVSPYTLRLLTKHPPHHSVPLIWTPAHSSLPGNEAAHTSARGLTDRAGDPAPPGMEFRTVRDRLVTFHEITNHYRLRRRIYPPPHPSLPRAQATTWRQLQTNSYPNPVLYSHIHQGLFTPSCALCHGRPDLTHIIWNCPKDPWSDGPGIATLGQWEATLLSSDPVLQDRVTQRAEWVAGVHGLLATRRG
ncbi:hypothetical protein HPB47_019605 [Ixodes persulcatus]|uniref:Uncharacterized protein n=1 Tax=Ixodes persulcatus TaxID=34615 RepID=A0AC60QHS7_IXOPE|nr:hypothetical protein HPB47_019605 [Ixodes persulcatus]